MNYDAIVFDLDGTLLDTLPDITRIVNSVISDIGMTPRSMDQIQSAVGAGVETLLRKLGVPEQWNLPLADQVTSMYSSMKHSEAVVYPGIERMLRMLLNTGSSICVLSNKPEQAVHKSISDHLNGFEFRIVRGSSPGKPAKPSPAVLLEILSHVGVSPERTLVAGDSEPDILVAGAAGTAHLSVLWGYRTRTILSSSGAVNFAETPEALIEFTGLQL